MKNILGIVLAILFGCLIGYFGVFVTVFADGGLQERLITIGIVLLVYCFLGFVWGFTLPDHAWKWGLLLGLPGVFFLAVYLQREYEPLYFLYMALILCCTGFSAAAGKAVRKRKKK
ncbi:MAG TPA: hypothetical protein DIT32_05635 [Peptococcaceae bacterium]|nr:hypothetical protein [Peptococcaceae bacterium]